MTTSSIATTLGAGSGIDLKSLVTALVDNQFSVKTSQLASRTETVTAQISGVAALKSAITGFSTALAGLVKGGTLTTSPTSSNPAAVRVAALSGQTVAALSGTLDVMQLAKPQSAASAVVADRAAAIGTGTFTLTFGTATTANGAMSGFTAGGGAPVAIAVDADHASLNGIAAAINAAAAGVTASIVGDGGGARLILKGATGASQAFTLDSGDAGLSDLAIGVGATGTTLGSIAQDAIVKLDGVEIRRASNTLNTLIDNVRLDLVATGTTTLGVAPPTAALTAAVGDFIETYNQLLGILKQQTDAKSGTLRADPAALNLQRQLARLPATVLTTGDANAPRTLAEVGVATNRDGTLRVDATQLSRTLATYPAAVEALFADGPGSGTGPSSGTGTGSTATGHGIGAALAAIATAAAGTTTGLGASQTRYTRAQSDLSDQQTRATEQAEAMRTRLTTQFARMDARVAAYKSTQTFLQNQIDAWNKRD